MNAWTNFEQAMGLRFAEPATEAEFRLEFARAVLPVLRATIVIGLFVMLLLTMRDVQISSVYGTGPMLYRIFVFIPLLGIYLIVSYSSAAKRHQQVFAFSFSVLLIAVTYGFFLVAPPIDGQPVVQNFRSMSVIMIILGVAGLTGLRAPLAFAGGALTVGMWAADAIGNALPPEQWPPTLIVFTGVLMLSTGMSYWIERLQRSQFSVRRALEAAKAHSERMLFASLPRHAAERVDRGERPIADAFVEAAVVFADIAGFTDLSKRIGPTETVRVLDLIFTAFDEIVERHGLERVKTMGDGYLFMGTADMGGGGVPEAAAAALDMLDIVDRVARELDLPLQLRVGMHSGPVVGGVVGKQRPTYDYWGDTMNVASRLETTGMPGRIHCSEVVYWRLEQRWHFESRGAVDIRGYGTLNTYFLTAPAEAP